MINSLKVTTQDQGTGGGTKTGDKKTVGNTVFEWDGNSWKIIQVLTGGTVTTDEDRKKATDLALKALDEAHKERLLRIDQQHIKEQDSELKYQTKLALAERTYLEQKKAILEAGGQSSLEIQRQLLETEVILIKQSEDELKRLREKNITEFDAYMENEAKNSQEAIDRSIDESVKAGSKAIDKMEDNKKREADILNDRVQAYIDLAGSIGDSFEDLLLDQEVNFGQFLQNTLVMALDALEKVMIMSIVESQIKAMTTFNPVLVAKAIANTILIKAAFGVAKAAVLGKENQYASGKYPVIGGDDGRVYDTNYAGRPKTGIYSGPQLGIFNEDPQRPEMVVDGKTTRQLILNYPAIYKGIRQMAAGYTPQFTSGKYPSSGSGNIIQSINSLSPDDIKIFRDAVREFRKFKIPVEYVKIKKGLSELEEMEKQSRLE